MTKNPDDLNLICGQIDELRSHHVVLFSAMSHSAQFP